MSAMDWPLVAPRPAARKPLYAQVREQLLTRVRGGEWSAGENLPNEYVLSSEFDVSIGTVRRAVADLESSGVLVREQGRGTYVAGRGAAALEEKFATLRGLDGERVVLTYELISIKSREADERERARLSACRERGVFELAQRVEANHRVVGIETSVLPAALVPRLETQMRFGQSVYPVLADYGHLVTRVDDMVGVGPADEITAAYLCCETGAPLLQVRRLAIGLDGQAVEWRTACYLPDRVRYVGAPRVS